MLHGSERRRVLLAEDDSLIREALRARLSQAGLDVHLAHTGAEALRRIVAIKPHVMILDINLPDTDGFGVLTALRKEYPRLELPVLILSARRHEADVKLAMSLGARDYLVKADANAELLNRIERLLRRSAP